MSDIVLLGGNILNGGVFSNKNKYGADRVIVFDWNANPAVKGDCFIQCDIKDSEAILRYLKKYDVKDLKFAYTSADLAVPTQQIIHEYYGLLTVDKNAVETTLYKSRMTNIWKEEGLLNRENFVFDNKSDLEQIDLAKEWIVKPNLCSGSRGISILPQQSSLLELEKAYERALASSWDDKVVIEEFVHGIEYTVEMLGDFYGNVAICGVSKKYHTIYNKKNKIATKLHYNPNDVSDSILEKIAAYGAKCYKAIGLKNSLGHLELIAAEGGKLSPLEIGARSSGYVASHCVDAVYNGSYLNEYAEVLRKKEIKNGYGMNPQKSSMLYFYDMPVGVSTKGGNLMEFMPSEIADLASDRTRIRAGMKYNRIDGDGERFGFEVISGERKKLTIENVCKAECQLIEQMFASER